VCGGAQGHHGGFQAGTPPGVGVFRQHVSFQVPPPAPIRELQATPKNSVKVPVAKVAYLQRQREAFTGSAQVRERSTKDLKRSW
jgi:hypothetical protein